MTERIYRVLVRTEDGYKPAPIRHRYFSRSAALEQARELARNGRPAIVQPSKPIEWRADAYELPTLRSLPGVRIGDSGRLQVESRFPPEVTAVVGGERVDDVEVKGSVL